MLVCQHTRLGMKQNTALSRLAADWKQGGEISGEQWLLRERAKDLKAEEWGKELSRRINFLLTQGRFQEENITQPLFNK